EYVYENGKHHIKNMSNYFSEIDWRNGKKVSENRIIWGDADDEHIAWMNDFVAPGGLFTIKMERLSLWDRLKGEEIHESRQRASRNNIRRTARADGEIRYRIQY